MKLERNRRNQTDRIDREKQDRLSIKELPNRAKNGDSTIYIDDEGNRYLCIWIEDDWYKVELTVDGKAIAAAAGVNLAPYWAVVPDLSRTTVQEISVDLNDYVGAITPDPITFTVTGLPNGLMLEDGIISGTTTHQGTHAITITATNRHGSNSTSFNLTITVPPPVWELDSFTETVDDAFSIDLADHVTGEVSITMRSGDLPAGVTFSNGIVSGTPTETGTFTAVFRASNAGGNTDQSIDFVIQHDQIVMFFGLQTNKLIAYDATNRQSLTSRDITLPSSGFLGGTFAANIGWFIPYQGNNIIAINLTNGSRITARDFTTGRSGNWQGLIDIAAGDVYAINDTNNRLYYFQTVDGMSDSDEDIRIGSGNWRGGFFYRNRIYVLDDSSNYLRVWNFTLPPERIANYDISLGAGIWVGATQHDGIAYIIDSRGNVRAIRLSDGARQTNLEFDMGSGTFTDILVRVESN